MCQRNEACAAGRWQAQSSGARAGLEGLPVVSTGIERIARPGWALLKFKDPATWRINEVSQHNACMHDPACCDFAICRMRPGECARAKRGPCRNLGPVAPGCTKGCRNTAGERSCGKGNVRVGP